MAYLSEGLFDDIEQLKVPAVEVEPLNVNDLIPRGPKMGADTGIANLIHDLIINENEIIEQYNNAIANLDLRPELIPIMQNIANEEMNHIGMLEAALELVSPNAKSTDEGEAMAAEVLDKVDEQGGYVNESLDEGAIERSSMSIVMENTAGLSQPEAFLTSGGYYDFSDIPEERKFMGNLPTHRALAYMIKHKDENLLSIKLQGIKDTTSELIHAMNAHVELMNIPDVVYLLSPKTLSDNGCGGSGNNKRCTHEIFVNGMASKRAFGKDFETEQSIVAEYLAKGKSVIQYVNYVNPQVPWFRNGPRARREGGIDCGVGVTMESLKTFNNENLTEDTEKKSNGKWVNKGAEGEHGEFKTKKAADAQRRAMFAKGFRESYGKEFKCKNCGTEFILHDQYMGACDCPECGQWYNLFGQKLKDPKYWFEDENEFEEI